MNTADAIKTYHANIIDNAILAANFNEDDKDADFIQAEGDVSDLASGLHGRVLRRIKTLSMVECITLTECTILAFNSLTDKLLELKNKLKALEASLRDVSSNDCINKVEMSNSIVICYKENYELDMAITWSVFDCSRALYYRTQALYKAKRSRNECKQQFKQMEIKAKKLFDDLNDHFSVSQSKLRFEGACKDVNSLLEEVDEIFFERYRQTPNEVSDSFVTGADSGETIDDDCEDGSEQGYVDDDEYSQQSSYSASDDDDDLNTKLMNPRVYNQSEEAGSKRKRTNKKVIDKYESKNNNMISSKAKASKSQTKKSCVSSTLNKNFDEQKVLKALKSNQKNRERINNSIHITNVADEEDNVDEYDLFRCPSATIAVGHGRSDSSSRHEELLMEILQDEHSSASLTTLPLSSRYLNGGSVSTAPLRQAVLSRRLSLYAAHTPGAARADDSVNSDFDSDEETDIGASTESNASFEGGRLSSACLAARVLKLLGQHQLRSLCGHEDRPTLRPGCIELCSREDEDSAIQITNSVDAAASTSKDVDDVKTLFSFLADASRGFSARADERQDECTRILTDLYCDSSDSELSFVAKICYAMQFDSSSDAFGGSSSSSSDELIALYKAYSEAINNSRSAGVASQLKHPSAGSSGRRRRRCSGDSDTPRVAELNLIVLMQYYSFKVKYIAHKLFRTSSEMKRLTNRLVRLLAVVTSVNSVTHDGVAGTTINANTKANANECAAEETLELQRQLSRLEAVECMGRLCLDRLWDQLVRLTVTHPELTATALRSLCATHHSHSHSHSADNQANLQQDLSHTATAPFSTDEVGRKFTHLWCTLCYAYRCIGAASKAQANSLERNSCLHLLYGTPTSDFSSHPWEVLMSKLPNTLTSRASQKHDFSMHQNRFHEELLHCFARFRMSYTTTSSDGADIEVAQALRAVSFDVFGCASFPRSQDADERDALVLFRRYENRSKTLVVFPDEFDPERLRPLTNAALRKSPALGDADDVHAHAPEDTWKCLDGILALHSYAIFVSNDWLIANHTCIHSAAAAAAAAVDSVSLSVHHMLSLADGRALNLTKLRNTTSSNWPLVQLMLSHSLQGFRTATASMSGDPAKSVADLQSFAATSAELLNLASALALVWDSPESACDAYLAHSESMMQCLQDFQIRFAILVKAASADVVAVAAVTNDRLEATMDMRLGPVVDLTAMLTGALLMAPNHKLPAHQNSTNSVPHSRRNPDHISITHESVGKAINELVPLLFAYADLPSTFHETNDLVDQLKSLAKPVVTSSMSNRDSSGDNICYSDSKSATKFEAAVVGEIVGVVAVVTSSFHALLSHIFQSSDDTARFSSVRLRGVKKRLQAGLEERLAPTGDHSLLQQSQANSQALQHNPTMKRNFFSSLLYVSLSRVLLDTLSITFYDPTGSCYKEERNKITYVPIVPDKSVSSGYVTASIGATISQVYSKHMHIDATKNLTLLKAIHEGGGGSREEKICLSVLFAASVYPASRDAFSCAASGVSGASSPRGDEWVWHRWLPLIEMVEQQVYSDSSLSVAALGRCSTFDYCVLLFLMSCAALLLSLVDRDLNDCCPAALSGDCNAFIAAGRVFLSRGNLISLHQRLVRVLLYAALSLTSPVQAAFHAFSPKAALANVAATMIEYVLKQSHVVSQLMREHHQSIVAALLVPALAVEQSPLMQALLDQISAYFRWEQTLYHYLYTISNNVTNPPGAAAAYAALVQAPSNSSTRPYGDPKDAPSRAVLVEAFLSEYSFFPCFVTSIERCLVKIAELGKSSVFGLTSVTNGDNNSNSKNVAVKDVVADSHKKGIVIANGWFKRMIAQLLRRRLPPSAPTFICALMRVRCSSSSAAQSLAASASKLCIMLLERLVFDKARLTSQLNPEPSHSYVGRITNIHPQIGALVFRDAIGALNENDLSLYKFVNSVLGTNLSQQQLIYQESYDDLCVHGIVNSISDSTAALAAVGSSQFISKTIFDSIYAQLKSVDLAVAYISVLRIQALLPLLTECMCAYKRVQLLDVSLDAKTDATKQFERKQFVDLFALLFSQLTRMLTQSPFLLHLPWVYLVSQCQLLASAAGGGDGLVSLQQLPLTQCHSILHDFHGIYLAARNRQSLGEATRKINHSCLVLSLCDAFHRASSYAAAAPSSTAFSFAGMLYSEQNTEKECVRDFDKRKRHTLSHEQCWTVVQYFLTVLCLKMPPPDHSSAVAVSSMIVKWFEMLSKAIGATKYYLAHNPSIELTVQSSVRSRCYKSLLQTLALATSPHCLLHATAVGAIKTHAYDLGESALVLYHGYLGTTSFHYSVTSQISSSSSSGSSFDLLRNQLVLYLRASLRLTSAGFTHVQCRKHWQVAKYSLEELLPKYVATNYRRSASSTVSASAVAENLRQVLTGFVVSLCISYHHYRRKQQNDCSHRVNSLDGLCLFMSVTADSGRVNQGSLQSMRRAMLNNVKDIQKYYIFQCLDSSNVSCSTSTVNSTGSTRVLSSGVELLSSSSVDQAEVSVKCFREYLLTSDDMWNQSAVTIAGSTNSSQQQQQQQLLQSVQLKSLNTRFHLLVYTACMIYDTDKYYQSELSKLSRSANMNVNAASSGSTGDSSVSSAITADDTTHVEIALLKKMAKFNAMSVNEEMNLLLSVCVLLLETLRLALGEGVGHVNTVFGDLHPVWASAGSTAAAAAGSVDGNTKIDVILGNHLDLLHAASCMTEYWYPPEIYGTNNNNNNNGSDKKLISTIVKLRISTRRVFKNVLYCLQTASVSERRTAGAAAAVASNEGKQVDRDQKKALLCIDEVKKNLLKIISECSNINVTSSHDCLQNSQSEVISHSDKDTEFLKWKQSNARNALVEIVNSEFRNFENLINHDICVTSQVLDAVQHKDFSSRSLHETSTAAATKTTNAMNTELLTRHHSRMKEIHCRNKALNKLVVATLDHLKR